MTAKYCRENKIPYFGLCLGMQVLCVEFARHVLGLTDANTTEIDKKTRYPVIDILPEQKDIDEKGGASISVSYVTKKPILYLGTGQEYNDLVLFDKEKIIAQIGL